MDSATATRLIRLGLVEHVDHPTHRPSKVLRLTDAGRGILRERPPLSTLADEWDGACAGLARGPQ